MNMSRYMECVEAHRNCTMYYTPKKFFTKLILYKGSVYTPEQFEVVFPNPNKIKVNFGKKKNSAENPDGTKSWMHK